MKTKILILSALLFSFFSAKSIENEIKTKLTKANIFLNGAQLTRTANIQVKSGINEYIITGLSADVNPNSIQVKGKGNFTIIGVKHRLNYLSIPKTTPEIKKLRDSVRIYTRLDERNLQIQNAFIEEKNMILQNKVIKSQNQNLTVLELQKLANFYRTRIKDINLKLLDLTRKDHHYKKRIRLLAQQENQIKSQYRKNTSEVVLTLMSEATISGKIELSYKVSSAGWIPSYDIRSNSGNENINVKYKATIYQTTGENWENIKLTLSTGQLNTNNTAPQLTPWYIQYYNQYKKRKSRTSARYAAAEAPSMAVESYDEVILEDAESSLQQFTQVIENQFNTEFKINLKMTVKSNSAGQIIAVTDYELPVNYRYLAIPKLNKNAYLIARVTGWEELYLLPGEISLYNSDTYIGKSYLDPAKTIDTLELSMGKDQFITVNRKIIKDHNKNIILGNSRKLQRSYGIAIKNNKSRAIELVVMDQIPISRISEIEVKLEENELAILNETNGFLEWKMDLKAKESKTVKFSYSVKFPKDKTITNLN